MYWWWRADGGSGCLFGGSEGQQTVRFSGQLGAPSGFPSIQASQKDVLSYFCAVHKNYWVYIMALEVPYAMWSEVSRRRMDNMDINWMPKQLCGAMRLVVMKSTIKHPITGMGCFARMKLGKRTVFWYWGILMGFSSIRNCMGDNRMTETFGEGALSVSAKDFHTYSVDISEVVNDFNGPGLFLQLWTCCGT